MVRRLAWLLVTIGLIALCIGDAALAIEQTVMTRNRVRSAAGRVLATAPVRRAMTDRVEAEVQRQVPGAGFLDRRRLDALAAATVRDPKFVDAFADALAELDDNVFGGRNAPVVLHEDAVTAAVRDAVGSTTPELTSTMPPSTGVTVSVDAADAPDLHVLAGVVRTTTRVAIPVGLVLIVVGIGATTRRRRAVARVGRWAIVLGLVHLVLFGPLAYFVVATFGAWPDVAAALIRGSSAPALAAGAVLVTAGAVAVGAVHRVDTAARRRARAAALEDLARRTSWRPPPRERVPSGPSGRGRSGHGPTR